MMHTKCDCGRVRLKQVDTECVRNLDVKYSLREL